MISNQASTSKLTLLAITLGAAAGPPSARPPEVITVDASAPSRPFPHFWERIFGSGRAALSLREGYRSDLRAVAGATAVAYVRFHGILLDELGVYDEDSHGRPVYNFSYVDQVYDGLLAQGVRPFVELSFMPRKLASRPSVHSFWYAPIVSPPKDYARWDSLISELARHLVERYGIEEVSRWYFEVWNEPNLDFWAGRPRQATYFELYDHTSRALKAVDPQLRVGGPATAQAAWIAAFLQHCASHGIAADFVSTHVYANDTPEDVFGTHEPIPRQEMVCRAVRKVHDEVKASALPSLPLIWSEFNASWRNEPEVTDAAFMGPWLAETVRQCDGLVDDMSFWTFSDVFEEQGVVATPFYGGYGLIAAGGIPKPAFNAFAMMHQLGDTRLEVDSDSALLTLRADGVLVLALWSYAQPGVVGATRQLVVRLVGTEGRIASILSLDAQHGDVHSAYRRMGAPRYPTQRQLEELRLAAALPPAEFRPLLNGELSVSVPAPGLVLVTIR